MNQTKELYDIFRKYQIQDVLPQIQEYLDVDFNKWKENIKVVNDIFKYIAKGNNNWQQIEKYFSGRAGVILQTWFNWPEDIWYFTIDTQIMVNKMSKRYKERLVENGFMIPTFRIALNIKNDLPYIAYYYDASAFLWGRRTNNIPRLEIFICDEFHLFREYMKLFYY